MTNRNPDFNKLQDEKACLETKIIDYKKAQEEMNQIQERNTNDSHKANVEKMNYYISNVIPNIVAKRC